MRMEEIQVVACLLEKYAEIMNNPTADNKIELRDKSVRIIKDGIVLAEKPISTQKMQLETVEYSKNVFTSSDIHYSPFEADRAINVQYWKNSYSKINFPLLMPIPLISWLALEKIPDVIDFCKIYLLAYTEPVTKTSYINPRDFYSTDVNVYSNVGSMIKYTDGQEITNRLVRFKLRYLKYTHGFPINQFTTEQVCNRIYKAYGSCVRDPYNMLRMSEFGAKTAYDTYMDFVLCIDGKVGNIPYHGFSKTHAAETFRKKKVEERHKTDVAKKGIILVQDGADFAGVYLASDVVLLQIMSDVLMQKLDDFKVYTSKPDKQSALH